MIIQSDIHPGSRFRLCGRRGSVVVALVGCLVLLGRVIDIYALETLFLGTLLMFANAAVSFLLADARLRLAISNFAGF